MRPTPCLDTTWPQARPISVQVVSNQEDGHKSPYAAWFYVLCPCVQRKKREVVRTASGRLQTRPRPGLKGIVMSLHTDPPTGQPPTFWFGRHKGQPLSQVPLGYLLWAYE